MKYFSSRCLVILTLILFSCLRGFAQPGDPQSDPDSAVPIPGLLYLIAGGVMLGVGKIIRNRKNRS
jgi:hypothetical protein